MKRYIAQFVRGGFPELYAVLDTHEGWQVSEPKPYHDANDEAEARNAGTFNNLQPIAEALAVTGYEQWTPEQIQGWLGGLSMTP